MKLKTLIAITMCLCASLMSQRAYCYNPTSPQDSFALLEDSILFTPEDADLTKLLNSVTRKISADENDKTYTIIVHMAARNDLYPFAGRNIKQMKTIGSNERIKIVIFFHMHKPGKEKVTKRLLIEKNQILQIGPDLSMDSGTPESLIECFKWSAEKFPADEYALFLWNHGTGIIEPKLKHAVNPTHLFHYDPNTSLIKLERSTGFLDYLEGYSHEPAQNNMGRPGIISRGICFDDSTANFLTNHDLKKALKTITSEYLGGKKIALLATDTCLMSMIEVVDPLEPYVEYFVGSQEVELATGYNYSKVLSPFTTKSLSPKAFASHIVDVFAETYEKITNDYTQSAIDLTRLHELKEAVDDLGNLLLTGLRNQKNKAVKEALKLSRDRRFCTHFDEPSFLDLGSLLNNIIKNSNRFELNNLDTDQFKHEVKAAATRGLVALEKAVIANVNGKYFKNISGLSIYWPRTRIHKSYHKSDFAQNTSWLALIKEYLNS